MHLEIILPLIPRIFTDFDYFEINIRVIIEICVLLCTQYPCSSVLSVGDSFAPWHMWEIASAAWDLFSHGFHRYSQILYIPVSVFICAICGRFPLLLEIYSPTDSTDIHRFYIFQYLCSSVLSVGDSLCCLRFILPRIPQIFTNSIYSNIRVHPRYLWETPSHPISVLICAICGRFLLLLEIYSPDRKSVV